MASRTYGPTLVFLLHRVCVYIVRWRAQLLNAFSDDLAPLLNALAASCEAVIAYIDHDVSP